MTWCVDCTLRHRRRGKRKRRHGVWIAHRVVVEEGKESNDTAVGCMPHRRRRGRRKQRHGGGLHTVSSSKGEKKATTRQWVARRVVVEEGEGREDTACGLHAASSSSLPPFALLPTLLTSLQPSQLAVIVFHVVAGVGNMGAEEVVVGWCMGLWMSTSLPWVGPHMGINQGARWQQWVAAQWWWWCTVLCIWD